MSKKKIMSLFAFGRNIVPCTKTCEPINDLFLHEGTPKSQVMLNAGIPLQLTSCTEYATDLSSSSQSDPVSSFPGAHSTLLLVPHDNRAA